MRGKLIVIEGLDGSGKTTQLQLLPEHLRQSGIEAKAISFPDYEDPSSTLVKMYLAGAFGKKAGDVNAYAASIFYAADRYASYKRRWGEYYEKGGAVVCGRYVTSNAIHQTAKLPKDEWRGYLDWLYDLEYTRIGIPKPDLVLFLDMPVAVSERLLEHRYRGDESKKDLHERDMEYMENCRRAALFAAEYSGWKIVGCADGDRPLPVNVIAEKVLDSALSVLK